MPGEPTINPYAPPAADIDGGPVAPGEDAFPSALFSPRQILAGAVFGSVLAGVIFLQANYRAMNRRRAANRTLLFGTLACTAFFAVVFAMPGRIPATPINIAAALPFSKLADTMQGRACSRHRAANGARQSNWLVFGVGAGTAVALLVVMFLILIATGMNELG